MSIILLILVGASVVCAALAVVVVQNRRADKGGGLVIDLRDPPSPATSAFGSSEPREPAPRLPPAFTHVELPQAREDEPPHPTIIDLTEEEPTPTPRSPDYGTSPDDVSRRRVVDEPVGRLFVGASPVQLADLEVRGRPHRYVPGVLRIELGDGRLRAEVPVDRTDCRHLPALFDLGSRFDGVGSFPVAPVLDSGHLVGALCPRPPKHFERMASLGENQAVVSQQMWYLFSLDLAAARDRIVALVEIMVRLHRGGYTTDGAVEPWLFSDQGHAAAVWLDEVVGSVRPIMAASPSTAAGRDVRRDAQVLAYALLAGRDALDDELSPWRRAGEELDDTASPETAISRAQLHLGGFDVDDIHAFARPDEPISRTILRAGYPSLAMANGLLDDNAPAPLIDLAFSLHYATEPPATSVRRDGTAVIIGFQWPEDARVQRAEMTCRELAIREIATRQHGAKFWELRIADASRVDVSGLTLGWRPLFDRSVGR